MLGLRPRLKTRPSLLELLQRYHIDNCSSSVSQPAEAASVNPTPPPLNLDTSTPRPIPSSIQSAPLLPPRPQLPPIESETSLPTVNMASVRFLGYEQTTIAERRNRKSRRSGTRKPVKTSMVKPYYSHGDIAYQTDCEPGSVFSVSGPVIIAENMIGCAMYELVRASCAYRSSLFNSDNPSRFESATTS